MSTDAILSGLRAIVGSSFVSNDPTDLFCYTGNLQPLNPQFIVRPASTSEISKIVKLAIQYQIPIIPRGFGTRSTPRRPGIFPTTDGGLILETGRLKTIRKVNEKFREVTAEAGVTIAELSNHLAPKGWRIIEGTMTPYCATVGSLTGVGPGLKKYGRREQHIANIEVVTGTGEIISTSLQEGKGMDLTGVFIASQGHACLGIITAVTYRIYPLPERLDFLNFEFKASSDTIRFLTEIDQAGATFLPGVFQVNVYPEAVLQLYKNIPIIRNQNNDFTKLLNCYPPFPSDVVGVILEGSHKQISLDKEKLLSFANSYNGQFVGPEPIRDYYVNRNWTGNTKCHEDVSRQTTSWTEPFFLCAIKEYQNAKNITEKSAIESGFEIGERFWARGTLRNGILGYTSCVTFDNTSKVDRQNAENYLKRVRQRVKHRISLERSEPANNFNIKVLEKLKAVFDPEEILYPGILYLD